MTISKPEVELLIRQAQDGNVRAFEDLVRSHLSCIRRYARAWAPTPEEADELAQEALLKVYKNIRAFRFQSSFQTWLFVVVRHVFLDQAKSKAAHEKAREEALGQEYDTTASEVPNADEVLAQEEEKRKLWAAIRKLPPEFRTALVLYDIEGHSYDEVADIEQVPVGTVKSRLARARKALAEIWVKHPGTLGGEISSHKKVKHA